MAWPGLLGCVVRGGEKRRGEVSSPAVAAAGRRPGTVCRGCCRLADGRWDSGKDRCADERTAGKERGGVARPSHARAIPRRAPEGNRARFYRGLLGHEGRRYLLLCLLRATAVRQPDQVRLRHRLAELLGAG